MPQFASYPLITTVAPDDLLLVHQDASGVEKTVKYSDLVSSSYIINVKAYGAVGDGVTDDSPAVQAAFNAAIAAGAGSVILFPASANAYIINTAINVPIGNITVVGYGAILANTSDTQYKKFNVNGPKSFIRFEGLAFNGGYSSMAPVTNNGTIAITDSSGITVHNCQFIQTNAAGVFIAGDCFDISVTNCKFFYTYIGVKTAVTGGNKPFNINVSNNFFRSGLGTASSANSGAVILTNTAPFGSGAGIVVSGNEARNYGKYGVYLSTAIHNSIVSNNFIGGAGVGIQVDASTGVVVSGNTLRDIVDEGILVQSGSDNVNVTGNVVNTTDSNSNGIKFASLINGTVSANNVTSAGDAFVVSVSGNVNATGNTFISTQEQVIIILGRHVSGITNFAISGNIIKSGNANVLQHIKLDSSSSNVENGLITNNFFVGTTVDAGIKLYAPANSINDINITGNNTINASCAVGTYFLNFDGTVNPVTSLNRIWCFGNAGIPQAVERSLNLDFHEVSSSLSIPYPWFAYQNGTIGMNASGGARSVELPPSADYKGWRVTVMKTDSSSNEVTITGNGGTPINGVSNYVLRCQNESVTIVNGNGEWRIESVVNRSYTMVYYGGTVNQSIPNNAETDLDWQFANFNGANAWSIANSKRLYVPAGAKKVRLTANFRFAYDASGTKRIIRIHCDGVSSPVWATYSGSPNSGIPGGFGPCGTITTPIIKVSDLPSGSSAYFYVTAEQDSGGALDIYANFDHTNFQIEVIE